MDGRTLGSHVNDIRAEELDASWLKRESARIPVGNGVGFNDEQLGRYAAANGDKRPLRGGRSQSARPLLQRPPAEHRPSTEADSNIRITCR